MKLRVASWWFELLISSNLNENEIRRKLDTPFLTLFFWVISQRQVKWTTLSRYVVLLPLRRGKLSLKVKVNRTRFFMINQAIYWQIYSTDLAVIKSQKYEKAISSQHQQLRIHEPLAYLQKSLQLYIWILFTNN